MRYFGAWLTGGVRESATFSPGEDQGAVNPESAVTTEQLPVSGRKSYSTGLPAQRPISGTVAAPPVRLKNGRVVVLHRDVFWLGKQWAVTGYGLQAISAKLEMKFDIEASRIWEEDLQTPLLAQDWFDPVDFEKALAFARQRAKDQPTSFLIPSSDER